ncbi:STAS domain-containing protein [Streptomyces sp. NBC_01190]|uniref:STAS domain-containing protein n=1 Tax=Streptomyces sp. NBC_01190 TaxID=2903767 RepID=UPI003863B417|nr:STAS domain-containing protein [Streptomyces sp. NBC_01190]
MPGEPDAGRLIEIQADGNTAVVRITDEIDADSAPLLAETLEQAALRAPARTVVDLSAVPFADSSILHALLTAQRRHEDLGGKLVVAGPFSPIVGRLFEVTGTASLFTLADTFDQALEA